MLQELGKPSSIHIEKRIIDNAKWALLKYPDVVVENDQHIKIYSSIRLLVTERGLKDPRRKKIGIVLRNYTKDLVQKIDNNVRQIFNRKGSNALIYKLGKTEVLVKENRRGTSVTYHDAFNRMDILEHIIKNDKRVPEWVRVPEHFALLEYIEETQDVETGNETSEFRSFMLLQQINSGISLQDMFSFCDGQIDEVTKRKIIEKYNLNDGNINEFKINTKKELQSQLDELRRVLDLVIPEYTQKDERLPKKLIVDLFETGSISRNYGNIVVEHCSPEENGGKKFRLWIIDQ